MTLLTYLLIATFHTAFIFGLPLSSEIDTARLSSERSTTLWQPRTSDTWQIVLDNPIDPTNLGNTCVSIYDIDLFGNSAATINALHAANKKVICYFSAGSYEPDRPDSSNFTSTDKGDELDGWPGEYWLDTKSTNVRNIMAARMQLAAQKGCDGVDPDNVDGYENDNGLGLTQDDSIDFVKFLAAQAATLQLAIGLKNAVDIIPSVLPIVHFAVNEQCVQYSECGMWSPFIQNQKPVFHIEYPSKVPNLPASKLTKYCGGKGKGNMSGFSTVLKKMDLGGDVQYCNGNKDITGTINN